MVPADHWQPISDLPPNHADLAVAELRTLSEVWLEQRGQLRDSNALKEFNTRLRREWAIETGVIERVYSLDRGTTQVLIERGIDASLIPSDATDRPPDLVAQIIRDQEEAVDWLLDVVAGKRPLSTSFIKALHALMTSHQAMAAGRDQFGMPVEAKLLRGDWKRWPNNPTRPDGSVHEYCPPEQVPGEMERLLHLHGQHEAAGVAPEVAAAWMHHRFAQIHPFQDGNGRIARSLASFVFLKAGWFPLVVTRDDRTAYIDSLEVADDGDLGPHVQLFAALQRRAFVGALGLASEVLRESARISQVIAAIGEEFVKREATRRQEWDRAKTIASALHDVARGRIEQVKLSLQQEIGALSKSYQFFVDAEPDGQSRGNWYRWQTIETARDLDYFANTREYSAWVRLGLHTESRVDVVLAFTGIGQEFRGLVGASLYLFRSEQVEGEQRQAVDRVTVVDELFQVNYKDDDQAATDRFLAWLDHGLVRGLESWRRSL